jgi:uncharacterized coiled-coil protein SlyX
MARHHDRPLPMPGLQERKTIMETEHTEVTEVRNGHTGLWIAAAVVVIAVVCIFAYGANRRQEQTISQLNAHESDMNSTISALQGQLSNVNSKMADMQSQATTLATEAAQAKSNGRTFARNNDPRFGKMQGQLDDEAKQLTDAQSALTNEQSSLATTQAALDQARTDLQGSITSTHDELNGSIARTHDELVALEQKGENNYDEFDLSKGKGNRLYREGPISIAVRKTDPKHKHYDLAMMVDDNLMQKKNVNLYEPIWLTDANGTVEVVVNKIDKDHIHGYVASPKYPQAQMKATSAEGTAPGSQAPQSDMQQSTSQPAPGTTAQPSNNQ